MRKKLDKASFLFYIYNMIKYTYKYIIICLILCLVFTLNTSAASYTPTFTATQNGNRAILVNQYIADYEAAAGQVDAYGTYNVYVYEYTCYPRIGLSGDGYISGSGVYIVNAAPNIPTGYTLAATNKIYDGVYTEYLIATPNQDTTTTNFYIKVWMANQWSMAATGLGTLTYRYAFWVPTSSSDVSEPEESIQINLTTSVYSQNYTIHPNIVVQQEGSLANVIADSIDASQTSQDIVTIINALNQLQTNDLNAYTNILQTLSEIEEWQGIFNDWLRAIAIDTGHIQGDVDSILQFITSYLPYLSSIDTNVLLIYNKLMTMDATQQSEAAAMASQYQQIGNSANSMSSNMSPPRPNINASQFDIENSVDSTQLATFGGLIGMILGNTFITKMLVIVFTGALIGFVLYGRKK